jgi:hypothetical protein
LGEGVVKNLGVAPRKNLSSSFGQKFEFNTNKVYHMQKNRLGATVSMKQKKIQSDFLSLRYLPSHAETVPQSRFFCI